MNAPTFSDDSSIRLGFEVECYIKAKSFGQCKSIFRRMNVDVGTDGSIEPPDQIEEDGNDIFSRVYVKFTTTELRTKPLPPKEAMSTLKTIFAIINRHGGTNDTCGLHVNISSADKKEMRNFYPVPFFASKIWSEILEDFDRSDNEYCQSFKFERNNGFDSIKQKIELIQSEKFLSANMNNWGCGENKTSRIEIRAFGNENYHKRFNDIAGYVKRIIKLFEYSCNVSLSPEI
jgi:hypothetical protein